MRIGIGTTKIEPAVCHGNIDGIGVYVQNLLYYYKKLQLEVVPISYPPLIGQHETTSFCLPYSLATLAALTPLKSLLNQPFEKKIDLFHATDYLIPRFSQIPVVATLHDAIMLKHPEWCNPRLRKIKNFFIKHSIQWATHIIAISHTMVPELVNYWGVDENKISVVYQGISDGWFEKINPEKKKQILNKFHLQENFILAVGTLQPRKNFIRIIQAYDALPEHLQKKHKLVLVGKEGWQSHETLDEIKKIVSKKKAVWLQYVTLEELRVLYQTAKLFLFPSLSEGFGAPLLEAFASNVPVITSNISCLPEIAGEAAYFVNPFDTMKIKQAICTLLTNPELCANLIMQGQNRVRQFTLQKCAEETIKVYKKIISKCSP
ncbi:MAG: glycosyl transferase, group 1 [Gammaproteobacteria bacterium]|jgi:alpha-1,3-rhamnosyl/mannosyltransferase|nr:glycosyl transferase, group 1 [Gammaproteobacteria bacterium]